jgi:hypothetical protein
MIVSMASGTPEVPSYPEPTGISGLPCLQGHKYKDLVLQVQRLTRAWQHLPIKHVSKSEEQGAKAQYWAVVPYTTPQHAM